LLAEVLHAKEERKSVKNIAASAQTTLARGIAMIATEAAESAGIKNVGLSGGVAYNKAIIKTVEDVCKSHGFALHTNTKVPRGDGGISFGQAVLTAMVKSGDSGLTL
jgi:hydrogenase maturation protein HypF